MPELSKYAIGDIDLGWKGEESNGALELYSPIFFHLEEIYDFWIETRNALCLDMQKRGVLGLQHIRQSLTWAGVHEILHAMADTDFEKYGGRLCLRVLPHGYQPAYDSLGLVMCANKLEYTFAALHAVLGPGRKDLSDDDWKDIDRLLKDLAYDGRDDPSAQNYLKQAFEIVKDYINPKVQVLAERYPEFRSFLVG